MPAPVTTYVYDANNRLLSETIGDAATAYTYDANGNTLTAGDKTYTYNTRGSRPGTATVQLPQPTPTTQADCGM